MQSPRLKAKPKCKAHVAELVDALDSGSSEVTLVEVRVLSWAYWHIIGLPSGFIGHRKVLLN